jgi:two-component system KDP operon response regulator KdpE
MAEKASGTARALGVIHLKDIVKEAIAERFAELRKTRIKMVMITGDNPLTAGTVRSFTGFLPPRPARSPRGHRGTGNDRAMTDLLPAWKISSPKPGNPALLMEDATAWLLERQGERQPLHDHGDGPACPERARMTRILVVEDQAGLQRALLINLRSRLFDVMAARTGREALALAASRLPDAVILDLGLPDIGGTEVIVELRRWYRPPVIVLSGRTSLGDKIGALDAGADDYVTKPFAMGELLARLRAALRRDEGNVIHGQPSPVVIGRWQVDLASYRVTRVDAAAPSDSVETLRLTPTEWAILELLLQRPGQLVRAEQLLTSVWGPGFQQRTNYLRFHMIQLRRKLEDNPARPRHLLTERGMGYRYQPRGTPGRDCDQRNDESRERPDRGQHQPPRPADRAQQPQHGEHDA